MKRTCLLILVDHRKETSANLQKILSAWGCTIKTRLGLHSEVMENCTEHGLLFLELAGKEDDHEELARKIGLLKGVKCQLVKLELDEE